jgi:hypothetical protein
MNHVLFWVALVTGAWSIKRKSLRAVAAAFVMVLLGVSLVTWQRIYAANIEYSDRVRIASAKYIDAMVPTDAQVGAFDLGPVGYFARQQIVDLGGHVNRDVGPFREAGGSFADYLHQEGICYLLLSSPVDGNGLDYAEEMGLADDERLDLISEAKFAVPFDTYDLGNGPVRNYMPAMEVYRVDWRAPDVCEPAQRAD